MQSDMHMVAVVVGCTNALVGTGWSNFFPWSHNWVTKLSKCYSHLVGASFLAVKAIWVLNGVPAG